MTTGQVIRRIRKSIGMTQTELGALINFSQPAVSSLERGGPASYDLRVLRLVARALQVPLAILVVESDEEADVDRRQFFKVGALGSAGAATLAAAGPASATSGARVGVNDVADIQSTTNQIHELDLVVGGDRLCHLAAGQVRYVEQLLDSGSYTETVGKSLASTAAETMTAAGWVHYDAGRLDQARRYYADAAQTATAADDGIASAHALINASILSYREGPRKRNGIHLAEAAQATARRRGGPQLRALGALREAEAQGVVGDTTAMSKAISRAYRAYDSGRGYDPEWVYLPEAELQGLTGLAYMNSGDHKTATAHLQAAIDSSVPWPRELTGWRVYLAENLVKAGQVAEACSLLTVDYETIGSVASARFQRHLDSIALAVRPHHAVPEVKEFLGIYVARV